MVGSPIWAAYPWIKKGMTYEKNIVVLWIYITNFFVDCIGCSRVFYASWDSWKGWHETYTDKYGRKTVVDIDVEVYGEETAPVLKVGWGKYGKFTDDNAFKLEKNHPVDRLMEVKKRGGKSTYIYEWVKNMKVNLNEPYGENYENKESTKQIQ